MSWMGNMNRFRISEETTTCPFNRAHQISAVRYHMHIVRCAKQTAGRDVRICTFNAKHIIDVPEYAHHIERCADRIQLDRAIAEKAEEVREAAKSRQSEVIESAPGLQFSGGDECWDDDVVSVPRYRRLGSYDPRRAIADRDVYRFPQEPMGKSARRQFRSETVALLRQIQEGGTTSAASTATAASAATAPGRRPRAPRMPTTTTLAVAARPARGRGDKVPSVATPVGLPPSPGTDRAVVTALSQLTIGRGRGRGQTVAMVVPGQPGAVAAAGVTVQ